MMLVDEAIQGLTGRRRGEQKAHDPAGAEGNSLYHHESGQAT